MWKKYSYPIFEQNEIEEYRALTLTSINQMSSSISTIRSNLAFLKKAKASQIEGDPSDKISSVCQAII